MTRRRLPEILARHLAGCALLAAALAPAAAQTPARLSYPATRTVDTVTDYHGTRIADPYRWLEAIESPDVAAWIKAENAITMPYLASLPNRESFRTRITALYDYARTGVPFWEGGRWFYTKNSGLQKQSVWFTRRSLGGAERVVLDPNKLSPDGSIALSGFSPSPNDSPTCG